MVQAAVDVRGGHVDQAIGLPDAGHLDHDPHREGGGLAPTAVEHALVVVGQLDGHRSGMIAGSGAPPTGAKTSRGVVDKRNVAKRLFRMYLAGGALAIAAYFLTSAGTAGLIVWDIIVVSMPVAIVVGVWRFRPDRRAPWLLLAVGLGIFALGDVIWNASSGGGGLGPSDIAYMVGYPLIAIGCLLLMRGDMRASMLALVDASIGAIGLAVIVWIIVLSGGVAGSGPTLAALVNAFYPVFDILIVTLLIRLALADRSREPAYWWLVGGFSLMLATDLAYAWLLRSSPDAYSPFLDLGWLVSYVAIGAAALHPSMVHLTRREAPQGVLSPIDVVWLGIPLFAVPILMLVPGHDETVDQIFLAVAAMMLASLVMVRIVSSAKDRDRAHARPASLSLSTDRCSTARLSPC